MSKLADGYIFACANQLSLLCPQLVEDLNTKMLKLTATYFALFICGRKLCVQLANAFLSGKSAVFRYKM